MVEFSNSIDKVYDKLCNLDVDGDTWTEAWQDWAAGAALTGPIALAAIAYLGHPEVAENKPLSNMQRAEMVGDTAMKRDPMLGDPDTTLLAKEFVAILIALDADAEQWQQSVELRKKYGILGGEGPGAGPQRAGAIASQPPELIPASPPGTPAHEFQQEVIRILHNIASNQEQVAKWANTRTPGDTQEWAVGDDAIRDKPPGMKDPRGFLNKRTLDNNQKKSTMKTFEDAYTHWVPPSVEEDNYRHERTVVKVPGPEKGEPWVHSDADFLFFLDWLVKQDWEAQKIVDVVREPHHYTKSYGRFLDQKEREIEDPLL